MSVRGKCPLHYFCQSVEGKNVNGASKELTIASQCCGAVKGACDLLEQNLPAADCGDTDPVRLVASLCALLSS